MSDNSNKPVDTLRDGALKVSIFENQSEKGTFYNQVPGKLYTDHDGQTRVTNTYSGSEGLRMANLMTQSHNRINDFKQQMKSKQDMDQGQTQPNERER